MAPTPRNHALLGLAQVGESACLFSTKNHSNVNDAGPSNWGGGEFLIVDIISCDSFFLPSILCLPPHTHLPRILFTQLTCTDYPGGRTVKIAALMELRAEQRK